MTTCRQPYLILGSYQFARMYRNRGKSENPPHIFAIADSSYRQMLFANQSQCVVISGESGSGKTESANFLVGYLSLNSQMSMLTTSLVIDDHFCMLLCPRHGKRDEESLLFFVVDLV